MQVSAAQIGTIDALSRRTTLLSSVDPRMLLLTNLVYIVTVVSFDRLAIASFVPFLLYPIVLITLGDLPVRVMLKQLLWALPFALAVGIFNPWFERELIVKLGPLALTKGWISFFSLLFRFMLTVLSLICLISIVGIYRFGRSLQALGMPKVFVSQLLFVYRYLFLLTEEAARLNRARLLRAPGSGKTSLRLFGTLAGQLLLRSQKRAERIHIAMRCRGFNGQFPCFHPPRLRVADILFCLGWCAFFVAAKMFPLSTLLGKAALINL
jgi:cobalt/nickel transport system permease protein